MPIDFNDPRIQNTLKRKHPDEIKKNSAATWTFIYGGVEDHQLYIQKGGTHNGLMADFEAEFSRFWGSAGKPKSQPGRQWDTVAQFAIMGRIAKGHWSYGPWGDKLNIISIWESGGAKAGQLELECLRVLLQHPQPLEGEPAPVEEDWVVISPSHPATSVGEIARSESAPSNYDHEKDLPKYDINNSKYSWNQLCDLKRRIHTDSGPTKEVALRILCSIPVDKYPELEILVPPNFCKVSNQIVKPLSPKNPWQQAVEKSGMATPGTKWWAPYSDHKESPNGFSFKEWISFEVKTSK